MSRSLADVVIHIDETLDAQGRAEVEGGLRAVEGVVAVRNPQDRPHLTVVHYRPDLTGSGALLRTVRARGVHAELIGL
jgi:hypothetical protein